MRVVAKTKVTRVYLIATGEVNTFSPGGALTATGREQAVQAVSDLRAWLDPDHTVVVMSDPRDQSGRRETSQIIATELGVDVTQSGLGHVPKVEEIIIFELDNLDNPDIPDIPEKADYVLVLDRGTISCGTRWIPGSITNESVLGPPAGSITLLQVRWTDEGGRNYSDLGRRADRVV